MVLQHFLGKEKVPGSNPGVGSKFNSTVSFHLLVDFFLEKCGKEMLFRRAFVSQLGVEGHSDWHYVHRSEGECWPR